MQRVRHINPCCDTFRSNSPGWHRMGPGKVSSLSAIIILGGLPFTPVCKSVRTLVMKLDFSGLCFTSDRDMFAVSCFDSVHLPQSDRRKGRPKTVREKAGHRNASPRISWLQWYRFSKTPGWRLGRRHGGGNHWRNQRPQGWDLWLGTTERVNLRTAANLTGDDARSETQAKLADHLT